MTGKWIATLFLVLVYASIATLAIASDSWMVVKDKNGVCHVIKGRQKTPATVAGPFAIRAEAEQVKARECSSPVPSRPRMR
ncbi:MAG TPA: hypothetical protein VK463_20060 [Desulfomonilaceae bacterium]|nr:hypothetical protein [Desulfomonilaceae bacterium]